MKTIKAVFFDYGGVISTEQVPQEVTAMLDLLNIEADLFRHWYYHYRPLYDLGCTAEEYWRKVLAACKVKYEPEVVAKLIIHDVRSWIRLDPVMLDWAEKLKKAGYQLGIISNMVREVLVYMQANFSWLKGDLFTTQIFSCDWQVIKPDPRIYRISLEQIGLKPEDCLFIDDLEANIKAAQEVGFVGFHYRGPSDLKILQDSFMSHH